MTEIAYLVPGIGLPAEERDRREAVANDLVGERASVTVLAADDGPTTIESAVEETWSVPGTVQLADAHRDDFDAMVIGCFGDPGLRPIRELLEIPVVGPAETTVHTAAQVADRFGWITILESTEPMSRHQAHEYGLGDRCVSVRSVDAPVESIDHDAEALADRMVTEGQAAVEEDGAEALFPGCMSLAFAQQHEAVQSALGVPFLDPAALSLEQAATWARHGVAGSARTYPAPDRSKLDGLLGPE
jgi:allantoin racemase